jgi:hypothetical protein
MQVCKLFSFRIVTFPFSVRAAVALISAAGILIGGGCGAGTYQEKLEKRTTVSKLDAYSPAEKIAGSNISVRVPKDFKSASTVAELTSATWIKRGYECYIKDGSFERPCYCYVGFIEKDLQGDVETKLQHCADFLADKKPESWVDCNGEDMNGKSVKCRKFRCKGSVEFSIRENGVSKKERQPCICEFYTRREGNVTAVIVWLLPENVEKPVKLSENATLVIGSLSF